jgi:hypothetical protein
VYSCDRWTSGSMVDPPFVFFCLCLAASLWLWLWLGWLAGRARVSGSDRKRRQRETAGVDAGGDGQRSRAVIHPNSLESAMGRSTRISRLGHALHSRPLGCHPARPIALLPADPIVDSTRLTRGESLTRSHLVLESS